MLSRASIGKILYSDVVADLHISGWVDKLYASV